MSEGERRLAAIVVADVVGYSSMMEQDETATLSKVLALLEDLAEPAVTERGGRVVKRTGDGMIAEFASVVGAVRAAVAVQEGVAAQAGEADPLRVRVGIHLCDVVEHGGDIYGDGVNVAARLEQAAEPDGILISDAAHEHLAGHIDAVFTDIGVLDLKNITRPVRGWCWGHTTMEAHTVAPASVSSLIRRSRLPARYSSFVGRHAELTLLADAVGDYRLVTVTGPGGVGKSSLAIEAARGFDAETIYVSLEEVPDGAAAASIADALGLALPADADVAQVIAEIADRESMFLVFDGCEQITGETSLLVDRILKTGTDARVLVTSREPLGLHGEHLIHLHPLPTGPDSPAVELFRDRLTDHDSASGDLIGEVCSRLEGLPLAIELAAAKARRIPLAQVSGELDRRLAVLDSKPGTTDRHQSLQATFDWTYDTLDIASQEAFRRLTVFQSGFGIEAADALLKAIQSSESMSTGDSLADLVDKSLLNPPDPTGRYRFLNPIRQFGRAQLEAHGEVPSARNAHATWVVGMTHQLSNLRWSGFRTTATKEAERERAEILEATRWSLESGDLDDALSIVASTGRLWVSLAEGVAFQEIANRVVTAEGPSDSDLLARALAACALFAAESDADAARSLVGRAERVAERSTSHETSMMILGFKALVEWLETPEISFELYERAIRHGVEAGVIPSDQPNLSRGTGLWGVGRMAEAEAELRRYDSWLYEQTGQRDAVALTFLASNELFRGNFETAERMYRDAIDLHVEEGSISGVLDRLETLSRLYTLQERWREAEQAWDECVDLQSRSGLIHNATTFVFSTTPARIMLAKGQWGELREELRLWLGSLPQNASNPHQMLAWFILIMAYSAGAWLVENGLKQDAANLARVVSRLAANHPLVDWAAVGETGRWTQLTTKLPAPDATVPVNWESIYSIIRNALESTAASS